MRYFIVLFLAVMGCEDAPYELYIDNSCKEEDVLIIKKGVRKLNKVTQRKTIDIVKRIKVNKEKQHTPFAHNNGKDTVVCIYSPLENDRHAENGIVGWTYIGGNILMYLYKYKEPDYKKVVLNVFMHELIHYIGASTEEHSPIEEDVFYVGANFITNYTKRDEDLICQYVACD